MKNHIETWRWGKRYLTNPQNKEGADLVVRELSKKGRRYNVINLLLEGRDKSKYLEIGVRRPEDNFNKIKADVKYSVDPGVENKLNPVDYPYTSDRFFEGLRNGEWLTADIKFDVIFIDGLHLADQVYRDFINASEFLKEDGFIVFHDCNPPSEWFAREDFYFDLTPAKKYWNGTTWKAFLKVRMTKGFTTTCVDCDWGVGIATRKQLFGTLDPSTFNNEFYEFQIFDENRKEHLNLMPFDNFHQIIENDLNKSKAKADQ